MKTSWVALVGVVAGFASLQSSASDVLKLEDGLDDLISPDARVETVFELPLGTLDTLECPTWVHHRGSAGFLIVCNVPGNVIYKLQPDGRSEVFLDRIYTGDLADALHAPVPHRLMIGANGSTLDRKGRVVYASYSAAQIVRVEKNGKRTVLADRFEGKRLNAPNDLIFRSDGTLYFTDSRGSSEDPNGPNCGEYWMICGPGGKDRVTHLGVYMMNKAGKVQLLTATVPKPNGLALSPDEKYLYVANSFGTVNRFDVRKDGTITNERIFIDMTQEMKTSGKRGLPDGLKVDKQGNVYSSGPGGVWILSSTGKHLGTILVNRGIANFTFGDEDARTLYMTSGSNAQEPPAVLRVRMKAVGLRP